MRRVLTRELKRLAAILERHGAPFTRLRGATLTQIKQAERKTGIRFDEDLRALYQFSNGGKYPETWFAASGYTPLRFCPLAEVCKVHGWTQQSEYDAEWNNGGKPWNKRIKRFDRHTAWLPFADFGNGNSLVYFDADPAASGTYGQIIRFQHDPDQIMFVATSLLTFLERSNDLLEKNADELLLQ